MATTDNVGGRKGGQVAAGGNPFQAPKRLEDAETILQNKLGRGIGVEITEDERLLITLRKEEHRTQLGQVFADLGVSQNHGRYRFGTFELTVRSASPAVVPEPTAPTVFDGPAKPVPAGAALTAAPAHPEPITTNLPLGAGPKRSILGEVGLDPMKGTTVPQKSLVNLNQTEGLDPFGIFDVGMDPENENPLRVDNSKGRLEVELGGASYTDGEGDGPNHFRITPLEYSDSAQRYLVSDDYVGEDASYQLLINVDRKSKEAAVYMRQHKGDWSEWKLAAKYGG